MTKDRGVAGGSIIDVPGVLVGNYQRIGRGWLTGTTAVLTPAGAVAGVDVRGGAPGTRETDLLRPENLVHQIHGLCLTGGSAFGLAAAHGMMEWLAERSIGFPIGQQPEHVVPIVPGAVIFDLGRGGTWANHPTSEFGYLAAKRARRARCAEGAIGAGTGARSGGLKGGVGSASVTLSDGTVVGALAVVNSVGLAFDLETGLPHQPSATISLRRPSPQDRRSLRAAVEASTAPLNTVPLNTTIGVVATNAQLTAAEATKLAQVAHDGLARAIRPAHLMNDGDTIFALATATPTKHRTPPPSPLARHQWLNELLTAGAETFAEAIVRGVLVVPSARNLSAYRDLCPTAFA